MGFILEGFFCIEVEVCYLFFFGLFLDIVVIFVVEDIEIVDWFLLLLLEKWCKKWDK